MIRTDHKTILSNTINSILLIVECILLFANWNNIYVKNDWIKTPMLLIVINMIVNMSFIYYRKIRATDYRTLFIVLSYIFLFGRLALRYFNLEWETSWRIQVNFTTKDMINAAYLSICCLQSIYIGFFINSDKELLINNGKTENNNRLFQTGLLLLTLGIPGRIITDINAILTAQTTGFYISIKSNIGLWDDFAFLVIPGLLCILEACKKKEKNTIVFLFFIYFVLVMSLTGDRRYYVSGILSIGLYYYDKELRKEKISIKKVIIIILIVYFINFLEVVRNIRNGDLTDILSFFSSYGQQFFDLSNLFVDVLGEYGLTLYSIASIIKYVPSELMSYQYGMPIIRSLTQIIPLGGYISFGGISEPSMIINRFTGLPVGGSLIGDMYANFGLFSLFFSFVSSRILTNYFANIQKSRSPLKNVLYYTSVYILINLVRCSLYEIVRPFVWCNIFPIIIYFFTKKKSSAI